jgi:hypothetical protein
VQVVQVEQVTLQLLRAVTVINLFSLQLHLMVAVVEHLPTQAVMLAHLAVVDQELVDQVAQPQVVVLVLVTQVERVEVEQVVVVVVQELLVVRQAQI